MGLTHEVQQNIIAGLVLGSALGAFFGSIFWHWKKRRRAPPPTVVVEGDGDIEKSPYPKGPLPPEFIAPAASYTARGACGVLGCPNKRPHSHVMDFVRRLKQPELTRKKKP